jgi:hypothetical protein
MGPADALPFSACSNVTCSDFAKYMYLIIAKNVSNIRCREREREREL